MTTTQPNPPPAEAFPVGEYLVDELEARGWSIAEFAEILGRPAQAVSEIINGHKEITRETASEIAAATRTSAETWLRLQDAHLLWSAAAKPPTKLSAVRQRAQLASLVPLRELTRRGFLPKGDVAAQERALRSLFGVDSLDQPPRWSLAARRTGTVGELSPAQTAWVGVVRWMAARTPSRPYDRGSLVELGQGLARSLKKPADLTGLVERLSSVGVRLVHVVKFDGGKIDGVAFTDDRGPVIGISGRIGRFDSVVFTLLHEIAHVVLGHVDASITLDVDLGADDESVTEQEANTRAGMWMFPQGVDLGAPLSRARVEVWAQQAGVHPSLVVGRLQSEGRLPWSHLRGLVPNVRSPLEAWSADLIRQAQETHFGA